MTATTADLSRWFDTGVEKGATHVIVACDTFRHEDFPVYVMPGTDVKKKAAEYMSSEKMLSVMEVYATHVGKAFQLSEHNAFHYEYPPETAGVVPPSPSE
jgi:hypothetical protein